MPLWAPFLRGPRSSAVRAGPCQVLVAVGSACQEPSLFFQSCPWRKPPAQMWAPRYFGITWVIAPLISSTGQISLGIAGGICFYEPLIVSLHSCLPSEVFGSYSVESCAVATWRVRSSRGWSHIWCGRVPASPHSSLWLCSVPSQPPGKEPVRARRQISLLHA